jgi:hypothetical protein
MTRILTNPLKVVQYRMQSGDGSVCFLACIRSIFQEGGVAAFWQGLWVALLTVVDPAIEFYVYDLVKLWLFRRRLAQHRGGSMAITGFEAMITGAFAKAVSVCMAYPIRMAKVVTQGQDKEGRERNGGTIMGVWREAWSRNGLLGLYEGLFADMSSCSLKAAVKFWTKESLDAQLA